MEGSGRIFPETNDTVIKTKSGQVLTLSKAYPVTCFYPVMKILCVHSVCFTRKVVNKL